METQTAPLPAPADMTDEAIKAEWLCIDCDGVENDQRTDALAAELYRRQIDI